MAAAEHLNKRLFHGTAHVFGERETVEPRYHPVFKTDVTFASNNEDLAEYYAGSAAADQGKLFGPIYEVEPIDSKESNADMFSSKSSRDLMKGPREHAIFGGNSSQTEFVASKKGFKPKKLVGWGINTNISGKGFPY